MVFRWTPAQASGMRKPPQLEHLARLVGRWTTEATHPAVPGVTVHGTVEVEWLEGEWFLIHRGRTDHPDFPDSIWLIGNTDVDRVDDGNASAPTRLRAHYFDSRGVFRVYEVSADAHAWRWWRDAPGFAQRFIGTFADGGDTIVGVSQLSRDNAHWDDDLKITYRRVIK